MERYGIANFTFELTFSLCFRSGYIWAHPGLVSRHMIALFIDAGVRTPFYFSFLLIFDFFF